MQSRGSVLAVLLLAGLSITIGASALAQEATPQDDNLNATLWRENSVEYKANTLSLYQLAQIRLDQALADKTWTAASEQTGNFQDLRAGRPGFESFLHVRIDARLTPHRQADAQRDQFLLARRQRAVLHG